MLLEATTRTPRPTPRRTLKKTKLFFLFIAVVAWPRMGPGGLDAAHAWACSPSRLLPVLALSALALGLLLSRHWLGWPPAQPPCAAVSACAAAPRAEGEFLSAPTSEHRDFRVFVVTFFDHDKANKLLLSLLDSDLVNFSFEVVLLNNNPRPFVPDARLAADAHRIALVHNVLRSRRSWGHLAQDWNTALVLGFENLAAPISSVVVCVQGDEQFSPAWAQGLWELHGGGAAGASQPPPPGPPPPGSYAFFTTGIGDALLSWTPRGVQRIGLFDERYSSGPGYQEADYFLCALLYAPDEVSLNDHHHGRVHNAEALGETLLQAHAYTGDQDPNTLAT